MLELHESVHGRKGGVLVSTLQKPKMTNEKALRALQALGKSIASPQVHFKHAVWDRAIDYWAIHCPPYYAYSKLPTKQHIFYMVNETVAILQER